MAPSSPPSSLPSRRYIRIKVFLDNLVIITMFSNSTAYAVISYFFLSDIVPSNILHILLISPCFPTRLQISWSWNWRIHISIPKHLEQSLEQAGSSSSHWEVSSVFCNILKSTQKYTQNKTFYIHSCCICFHLKYLEIISNVPNNNHEFLSLREENHVYTFSELFFRATCFLDRLKHIIILSTCGILLMSACRLKILALGSTEIIQRWPDFVIYVKLKAWSHESNWDCTEIMYSEKRKKRNHEGHKYLNRKQKVQK